MAASAAALQEEEEDDNEEVEEEPSRDRLQSCDTGVALRLVAAACWHVVRIRQVHSFPRVLALLEALGEAVPDMVHFRHFVKVRLGLQAKMIMGMLKEEEPHGRIYEAMDVYFPEREGKPHPHATPQDLVLVRAAQDNFRDLVFGLLRDHKEREKYVQEHLENDYGEAFMKVVEDLFCDYLVQLESTLLEPDFQQLVKEASLRAGRPNPQPNTSILTEYLIAMGHEAEELALPPSPSQSSSPIQSEEEEEEEEEEGLQMAEPCTAPISPTRARRGRSRPLALKAQDPGGQPAGHRETGKAEEVVLDSNSEEEGSPLRKDGYQCTQHNTLIPTFQEHLGDAGSRCTSCLVSLTPTAV